MSKSKLTMQVHVFVIFYLNNILFAMSPGLRDLSQTPKTRGVKLVNHQGKVEVIGLIHIVILLP